ncbi:hypothetical protein AMAG_20392 [Allomyces macrogynus ATCC 38327]|uniref:Uncharacterized protein n=1 Tax=Allomyces macrogynus (strain ATCC 38327) TaxID=578462 RepID=A0A0L0TA31_ALLM3|nr:hypothetical protein AMAG_20392 [Allomyces macrogynus ATCC 38327]|eukprot:KNE71555.1 hypothetical protein AMAG_20392 [Allomyces macrogynus ATCC 38327]
MASTTTTTTKRSRSHAVRLVTVLILFAAVLTVLGAAPLARAQEADTDLAQDMDADLGQDQLDVELAPGLGAQATATGQECAARCAMEDTNCIARCHGVPSGGNDVALNTGRCVSNCQVAHPVDPAAQSACFSRCQASFVDPTQSTSSPAPAPEPTPTSETPSPSTPASEPAVTATPGTAQEPTTITTASSPPATPTSSASESAPTTTGTATTGTGRATTTTTRSATSGIMTTKAIPKTMATPPVDSNAQAAVLARGAPFAAAVAAAVAGML